MKDCFIGDPAQRVQFSISADLNEIWHMYEEVDKDGKYNYEVAVSKFYKRLKLMYWGTPAFRGSTAVSLPQVARC